MSNTKFSYSAAPDSSVRIDEVYPVKLYPEYKENGDTLLSITVRGIDNIEPAVRTYGLRGIPSFVLTGPIVADTNGSGKWNPPPYRLKGN